MTIKDDRRIERGQLALNNYDTCHYGPDNLEDKVKSLISDILYAYCHATGDYYLEDLAMSAAGLTEDEIEDELRDAEKAEAVKATMHAVMKAACFASDEDENGDKGEDV